eukprot:CAMPEP_0168592488 /NCGR_PEP_ID=MMETSP0420-20121227/7759_1 /TAXON_ID=498008 /ORGANISM="Pessonella sp." /LENGTH=714 /DNA_ID=CAMNT_0008628479 /DNA_START=60 /DNA_END=2204 /DNA_ORIENTATION=+
MPHRTKKDKDRSREREKSRDRKLAHNVLAAHSVSPGTSEDEIVLSGDTGLAVSVNGDGSSGDDTSRASTESASRPFGHHSRSRSVEQSLDKLQDSIASDASSLLEKFRDMFDEEARNFSTRPNVLVAGCTGAGKSTLINTVFGRPVARTGAGVPITQHFERYELDNEAVVIYDSKGLEVGDHNEFIDTTKSFLVDDDPISASTNSKSTSDEESNTPHKAHIHVVWYIINSAGSRFQPFEGDVCQKLFNKLPIIFILNKADLSSTQDRENLRKTIINLNLGNCIGIVDTICTPSVSALKIPDVCPACGSDDVDIKRKRRVMICEDCGHSEPLTVDTGLTVLVSRTMEALPVLARDRFVAAQRVSMHTKNVTARKIITEYVSDDFGAARLERQLFKMVAKMLIRLSVLWEFREHGHEYGVEIAKEHMGQFSYRDKLFLMLHKQDKHQDEKLAHTAALGVVWNRCVRLLYRSLFLQSFDSQADLNGLLQRAFVDLNQQTIDEVAKQIEAKGVDALLDKEFPQDLEEDKACSVSLPLNSHIPAIMAREDRERDTMRRSSESAMHKAHSSRPDLMSTTGHMPDRHIPDRPSSADTQRSPRDVSMSARYDNRTTLSQTFSDESRYGLSSSKHRHRHKHKDLDVPRTLSQGSRGRSHRTKSSRSHHGMTESTGGHHSSLATEHAEAHDVSRRKSHNRKGSRHGGGSSTTSTAAAEAAINAH